MTDWLTGITTALAVVAAAIISHHAYDLVTNHGDEDKVLSGRKVGKGRVSVEHAVYELYRIDHSAAESAHLETRYV